MEDHSSSLCKISEDVGITVVSVILFNFDQIFCFKKGWCLVCYKAANSSFIVVEVDSGCLFFKMKVIADIYNTCISEENYTTFHGLLIPLSSGEPPKTKFQTPTNYKEALGVAT